MTNLPRILIITRNLPPLLGGMERLNWHMADELAKDARVRVISPRGSAALKPAAVDVDEVPLAPLWRFIVQAAWRALRIARQWRPDIVLAGSGLTAPLAFFAARACRARSVVYVHGLDLSVSHSLYRLLWLPALKRMDRIVANSRPTAELARKVGVPAQRIGIVYPGVDLPASKPDPQAADAFREQHQLADRPLLLSVGRLTRRKGLREFVAGVLPRVVEHRPDLLLAIVGDVPTNALQAEAQSPESIQHAAYNAGVGDNVRFLGPITDRQLLASAYRAADVHVFPVQNIPGDPEGFGMVAVEAAANGLPTVAYATGGVVDAVAEDKSGHLVAPGDYAAFADVVIQTLAEKETMCMSCVSFARRFAWPAFGAQIGAQLSGTTTSEPPA